MAKARSRWGDHDHSVLVLQGGGALGAYQAGAFEGIANAGVVDLDWIAGVSIGAINAALIAGNPPERRVERVREFWTRVSQFTPPPLPMGMEMMRPMMNGLSTASAMAFGVPGFFVPRKLPPAFAPAGSIEALSYYDTEPLRATLEDLVDFDLINRKQTRLSLGAVHLRTGNSVYFDNHTTRIGPEHVMASGALPPGFPPVEVDGELYWDGGIVSNSPLTYVTDENRGNSSLIMQIDVFSAAGALPKDLQKASERVKDIQYASKTRFNIDRIRQFESLRASLARVLDKLPKSMQNDPDVKALKGVANRPPVTLVHLINRHTLNTSQFKDCEFSRATVFELWAAGLADVNRLISEPASMTLTDLGNGLRVFGQKSV